MPSPRALSRTQAAEGNEIWSGYHSHFCLVSPPEYTWCEKRWLTVLGSKRGMFWPSQE